MKNPRQILTVLALLVSSFNLLPISGVNGQSSISGTIQYANGFLTPMDGIRVNLTDLSGQLLDTIHTDGSGFYIFHNVPDGSYVILPQCTKPWGGGASNDALMIMKHFVGMVYLSGLPLKASDLDASGSVNAIDALTDVKRFVGMVTSFISGDWAFEKDTIVVTGNLQIIHNIKAVCFGDVNASYIPTPCIPHPTPADAGPDQTNLAGNTVTMAANAPSSGTGLWVIASGQGGSFNDPAQPNTIFNGMDGETYQLVWTITTSCFSTNDTVVISLHCPVLAIANAGPDQLNLTQDSTYLAANDPPAGQTGTWSIVSGPGGSFEDIHVSTTLFTGIYTQTYVLAWTISSNCGSSPSDTVIIDFNYQPDSLFLVGGSCTSIGWNPAAAIPFTKTAPGKFTITAILTIIADNGFKFLVEHSWNNNWGQAFGPYGQLAQVPNQNATVPANGFYQINVDFTTMMYSCVIIDTVYEPDSLFLVGGSCPVTGWDPQSAIPFTRLNTGYYTVYAPLSVNGDGLKFLVERSMNNNWGQAIGQPGILAQDTNQNAIILEDGFYRIDVNFTNMTYSCVKTDWGIIGTAIPPYNWGADTDMSYIGGSEPFSWQISNVEVHNGEFKFRANNSWLINFGDDGQDGNLEHFGANIPVNVGEYTFKLIIEPNNWTYSLINNSNNPCPGMPTFTYGGQTYNTVQIGAQCWMKENLNIGTMIDASLEQLNNGLIEKYCYYNDTVNCAIYGGLYQWDELMQYVTTQGDIGICPAGWHIPTDSAFTILTDYLGGLSVAGGKMKETGNAHWSGTNPATNSSGFTALGGGYMDASWNNFFHLTNNGYFWSSTLSSPGGVPWYWKVRSDSENVERYCNLYRGEGFSVRCLKDSQ